MPRFNDYSISSYGGMVIDERRTRPYVEALKRTVKPGDVVLDIGTGTGFFAFLAAQLGAARVYAIEPDDAIDVARLCAANNVDSDRIRWIQGMSTEIDLPERVDVVIGDLHGTLPFFKHNIESLKDARTRHLKPGGHLFPCRDVLYVAPASADAEYDTVRKPWQQRECSIKQTQRLSCSTTLHRLLGCSLQIDHRIVQLLRTGVRMLCRLAGVMGQQGIGILATVDDGKITGAMFVECNHRQVQLPPLSE